MRELAVLGGRILDIQLLGVELWSFEKGSD